MFITLDAVLRYRVHVRLLSQPYLSLTVHVRVRKQANVDEGCGLPVPLGSLDEPALIIASVKSEGL